MSHQIVIVASKRTPIGQLQGCFNTLSAPQLASAAIQATLAEINLPSAQIQEVILGCVLTAGIGQAPARQAALLAGLPNSIGATTVNKMCGSGMKAIMLAHDAMLANKIPVMLAGGMESMTNAPYLLLRARQGYRMGHNTVYDHMFLDGLEDAYDKGKLMGHFAELCAEKYHFSRQQQDEFALHSLTKAQTATTKKYFTNEIAPVTVTLKNQTQVVTTDELLTSAKPEKIPHLKPAFKENGTVTAANSSGISDGAAVHVLMLKETAVAENYPILATILGHATHAQEPAWFTTAPIGAIQKVLQQVSWQIQDVDLFEINEAFAVVPLACMKELDIPPNKVNIRGGACALGHPIGASGARILTTLIYALKERGLNKGIAALCIGGGEATAMAIEING